MEVLQTERTAGEMPGCEKKQQQATFGKLKGVLYGWSGASEGGGEKEVAGAMSPEQITG